MPQGGGGWPEGCASKLGCRVAGEGFGKGEKEMWMVCWGAERGWEC